VKTILSEAEAGMPLQDPRVVVNYDDEMKLIFTEYGAGGAGDLKVYASDGDSLVHGEDSGENVYCDEKCKTDFGDIRFTASDGTTELEHWLEEKVNSDYALFWVKIPNIPADPDTITIYVFYGKDDATSASTESREDFTGYTEVEEADDIQKTAYHVDFADIRNRTTYLYKDYTADYFSEFAHHLNIKRVTHAAAAFLAHLLLANAIGGEKALRDGNDEHIYLAVTGDDHKINMAEWDTGGANHPSDPALTDSMTLGTMYYVSLRKYGTALVLDTYTTARKRLAGGDGDFGHQTLTLQLDYSFRYNYVGNSYDSGTAQAGSSDMEDLFFRKYVSPEPANGDWGSEEAVLWTF